MVVASAALAVALAACSPALNWRSVAVPEAALQVMLPCKPDNAVRTVELAGAPLALSLLSCDADGATFAVSYATLTDPARAGVALEHWRAATLARIGVLKGTNLELLVKKSTNIAFSAPFS